MRMVLLFLFCSAVVLQAAEVRNLQIDTWPAHAEVSLHEPPSSKNLHPIKSPWITSVPSDSGKLKIFFFKPGYQDTAITVRLKSDTNNFVFIHLNPEPDSANLEEQNAFLRGRAMRIWGKGTMWASIAPLLVSGAFALQAIYKYDHAQTNSTPQGFPDQDQYRKDYLHYRQKVQEGDEAKTRALISLGTAGAVFLLGAVLSF